MPTKTFEYEGGWQSWDVPKRLEWVEVTVIGAGSNGVRGGKVSGRINVKRINSLRILVGQQGQAPDGRDGGAPTVGGGAAGGSGRISGGWSGGGATILRANSRTGAIKAVGAGAGGTSGDGGPGGPGGGDVGEAGAPAPGYPGAFQPLPESQPGLWDYDTVGNATGGTQVQGGIGGSSDQSPDYSGSTATDEPVSGGGRGGSSVEVGTYGGGGGGGGWHGGGGGQAGLTGVVPAGGGAGGSSSRRGLTGYTNTTEGGSAGHGRVVLTWVTPKPARQPPTPPTEVKVGGEDYSSEMATHSVGRVTVKAKVGGPEQGEMRIVALYSTTASFSRPLRETSELVERGKRATVQFRGLPQNTLIYARLYTKDNRGLVSTNYTALRFWTNRSPGQPNLITPSNGATISALDAVRFDWSHNDPDDPQAPQQRAFELQYRRAAIVGSRPGDWVSVSGRTYDETWVAAAEQFQSNHTYEWRVRTQDPQSAWGPWSETRTFFVSGISTSPELLYPVNDEAVEITEGITALWGFRDPVPGALQARADLRYRVVGTEDWHTVIGDAVEPGGESSWALGRDRFRAGQRYEWQVRTVSTVAGAMASQWSDSETFWAVSAPGLLGGEPVFLDFTTIEGVLGCGNSRVFVYDRGGTIPRGEVTPMKTLQYGRSRDDISRCLLTTNEFGEDCGDLLRTVHAWVHELVIFRDGKRVWEGPITRIEDRPDGLEIEAKDVLGYVYRRILRQGYNDAYRLVNNTVMGRMSIVERAVQNTMNALAPDDPNLLGYLTSLNFPDDAAQSRVVPDMSKTAWEDIDDMAANAGLDYTAVGRRIIYWDTHRPLGRLPELRTKDFDTPPIISEYGMLLATVFGVTNNAGIYGVAIKDDQPYPANAYGIIEQLASAYGEEEGSSAAEGTLTSASREALERTLTEQAERNIANRYPTPVIVRVPDNSALSPEAPVPFDYLVPGVWVPVRAQGTLREVSQWQKLDSVVVEQDSQGEKVRVTLSPAPNGGQDPDAEQAGVEE